MPEFESILESKFYNLILEYIEERHLQAKYKVIHEPKLSEYTTDVNLKNRHPDFIILKGSYPYIIIEVVGRGVVEIGKRNYQNAFYELEAIGADYFVITDLRKIIVFSAIKKEINSPEDFASIFGYFQDLDEEKIQTLKLKVVEAINKIAITTELISVRNLLANKELINFISYNSEGRYFHFNTNPEFGLDDFENLIFQSLLHPVTEQVVCRYTTFDSLFHIINNRSFRMGSNIAMNDRWEIDYVDKYIGLFYKPLQSLSLREVQQLNTSYISSCTSITKEDNLTMYRLYAEDSKGVCLCFNVANGQSRHLLVRKISYSKENGLHPELELIKKISNILIGLSRFRFLYLNVWKHFFKTHDYAIEDEIRLLYFDNTFVLPKDKGWVVTNPDRILSKYVTFDLNNSSFPLKLYKIILGPNCPETQLNRRQIEVFLDAQCIHNVTVENSKIESYRKN